MPGYGLTVALGDRRWRVERPWGDLPEGLVTAVAVDSRGHVYVALRADPLLDAASPRIVVLDPDGRRIAAWGADLIAEPHLIAIDHLDRVLIVDRDAHQVVIADHEGRRLGALGGRHHPGNPFNHPSDVAVAADGDIYVTDGYAGHHVHRFSADGRLLASWGELGDGPGQFLTPHAVWVMRDGRVVVVDRDNNRLQVFTAEGRHLATWTGYFKPMDIWGDADDRLYVSDQIPTLTCLVPDGTRLGRCRPVLNGAHGIWGDPGGRLYLAELAPSRLTRLTPLA
jgi:peptidylglycine monooxygenase